MSRTGSRSRLNIGISCSLVLCVILSIVHIRNHSISCILSIGNRIIIVITLIIIMFVITTIMFICISVMTMITIK